MCIIGDPKAGRNTPEEEFAADYGYVWADWLYGKDKNGFMVDVYHACHRIDECADAAVKATKLQLLREKVRGCNEPWREGIEDFIHFETRFLELGQAPLEILGPGDDYHVLGVLHAAYLHGAFRGICRTPSGAEWVEQLGEFCAAAVHQGFKWLRNRGVTDWELPSLEEAWCKGAVMLGLVCMYVAVDIAGEDQENDAVLERIHTVIAAHHLAGATWMHYRDEHPHRWWDKVVRGRAPSEDAIRIFGKSIGWPEEMVDVVVRGAKHVNSFHFEGTRGFLIWDHTPRLKSRLMRVCGELKEAVGDMSDDEAHEHQWRASSWMAMHTTHWRGRGDVHDQVQEISVLCSLIDVLRESRPQLTSESIMRVVDWSRDRASHLSPKHQESLLDRVRCSMEESGRTQSTDCHIYGLWDLAIWCTILSSTDGGKELPSNMRELAARHLSACSWKRRVTRTAFAAGQDTSGGCLVCVGDALFRGLVDNRPSTGVIQSSVWGALLQHDLGL